MANVNTDSSTLRHDSIVLFGVDDVTAGFLKRFVLVLYRLRHKMLSIEISLIESRWIVLKCLRSTVPVNAREKKGKLSVFVTELNDHNFWMLRHCELLFTRFKGQHVSDIYFLTLVPGINFVE